MKNSKVIEFEMLSQAFPTLMHKILLVWKHSEFYNTSERLQILVQEINNAIIDQSASFANHDEIFKLIDDDNADDAVAKIQKAIDMGLQFKSVFLECNSKARKILSQELAETWEKASINTMFKRLDLFEERCRDIMEFTSLVQQFGKLEKIFIGGTKGKQLTDQIREINETFNQAKEKFKNVKYKIMDISATEFDAGLL